MNHSWKVIHAILLSKGPEVLSEMNDKGTTPFQLAMKIGNEK
jgi:ankyrin repeat protein